ncbi:NADH:ubiquinone reductase (Na(+)-transporting) subunit C [Simkania negevensis]|uniref:Na(+)-translocating NADH-quinone reductase subunit C n=1 Tax=Simkania negevensis TaxID=83561 RepID=A0ABS3AT08_9BACT|nr:NADH:ubiquinone reductase (Na(+)-transporting) subunit C [Simkania negevensis]
MSKQDKQVTNVQVILFMVVLCFVCALILSTLAILLRPFQERARAVDESKQMLAAAAIYNPQGYFVLPAQGIADIALAAAKKAFVPAKYNEEKGLLIAVPSAEEAQATEADIAALSQLRMRPMLVDSQGNSYTFEAKGLDLKKYIADNSKTGYANLPFKLIYFIEPNVSKEEAAQAQPAGFLLPVAGNGLWGPIYGYLAIDKNCDTVVGTTWYKHIETPGLGAIISAPEWQGQFPGKLIFQPDNQDITDFKTAPLGITVVKGKVIEVYGDKPKAKSAVDGISGATLTGNGVTAAYKDSLTPYRNFFIKFRQANNLPITNVKGA